MFEPRLPLPLLLFILVCTCGPAQKIAAQDAPREPHEPFKNWEIKPILGVQAWSTYTFGHKDFDPETGEYVDADNRLNFMLRRLRFGSTAKIGDRLFIKFLGAADFVGADQRAGTVGGVNNGGFPELQVWDVFAQYRLSKQSEALYVIGGYLRPPIGRESMSGAYGVSSFEKGFNQWYVRTHLVGVGPGGTGGAYLGGLLGLGDKLHVDYRTGVMNPQNDGISAGRLASSLFVTRVNFMFGDPEKDTWTYGLPAANSFGKRQTLTVALNLAHEGGTGAAPEGIGLLGVDFLVNTGHFHVEGEYHALRRSAGELDYNSATWMLRAGVNIPVNFGESDVQRYLEPTVMYWGFDGATDLEDYPAVLATNFVGNRERHLDVGVNYHLLPGRVRLGLHYNGITGDIGELPPDGALGWFGRQAGIGGIERGDYVGFEVIVKY